MTSEWYHLKEDEPFTTFISHTEGIEWVGPQFFRYQKPMKKTTNRLGVGLWEVSIKFHYNYYNNDQNCWSLSAGNTISDPSFPTHSPVVSEKKHNLLLHSLSKLSVNSVWSSQSLTFVMSDWHEFLIQICPIDWESFKTDPIHLKIFSIFKVWSRWKIKRSKLNLLILLTKGSNLFHTYDNNTGSGRGQWETQLV